MLVAVTRPKFQTMLRDIVYESKAWNQKFFCGCSFGFLERARLLSKVGGFRKPQLRLLGAQ